MRARRASPDPVADAWRRLLVGLGYDLRDAHLKDSPARVARFLSSWHTIVGTLPPRVTTFPNRAPRVDELVAVGNFRFYSVCAHHGLPFFGEAAVGYVPDEHLVGLSKFARVVDYFAHRFQVQERLTHQIASYLEERVAPHGVAVVLRGEHLCMSMRGVERPGHRTITSDLRGVLRKPEARAELLALLA